jgi:hypothetical protein
MKRISHFKTARIKLLHIETEGAIVNIQVGLHDHEGNEVTSIEIRPDKYSGDMWELEPEIHNIRVIRRKNEL